MPIPFPPGVTAIPTALADFDDVLAGPRVTDFRFELLSRTEAIIGVLDSVQVGGELRWDYNAAVKGGGLMTVTDLGDDIDWLNVRIRPIVTIAGIGIFEPSGAQEIPLGIFLPSAPVETWAATGRSWAIELLDKNSILDTDVPTDASGNPITYSLPAGTDVASTVKALIQGTGEAAPAIDTSITATLNKPLTWDLGATRLQVINNLLDATGFFSLWMDHAGQYRISKFVEPEDRPPVYELLTPFTPGDLSLMAPDWTRDRDIYSIPNRYVAVSQGSADQPALVSVATNVDPASPFSFPSRGRWITHVTSGVEADDQGSLDVIARRGLTALTNVNTTITVDHIYLPDLLVNRTVRFVNPDAGLDMLCVITNTNLPLDPMALCKTELREAVVDMSVGV